MDILYGISGKLIVVNSSSYVMGIVNMHTPVLEKIRKYEFAGAIVPRVHHELLYTTYTSHFSSCT